MATTSPDNIKSPNAGDQYALVQDLGALADTTQAALVKRANLYTGTSAQRTAFTTASEGTTWQDTNGTKNRFTRKSGSWVADHRFARGYFTLSLAAGVTGTQDIQFPAGTFSIPPTVQLTGGTGTAAGTGLNMWVSGSITTTGASISAARTTAASQLIYWTAIGI